MMMRIYLYNTWWCCECSPQVWKQVSAFKETHKSTGVGDRAEAVLRAKWRVQALLFEKRVHAETKKAAGISKINNVRRS